MPELKLFGCRPEPLICYLKALGVLRLVANQRDSEARGMWKDDVFVLSSVLDRTALLSFFLNKYEPTPLVAPWNGGSGFYVKWSNKKSKKKRRGGQTGVQDDSDQDEEEFKTREAVQALQRLERSTSSRLEKYRNELRAVRELLARFARPIDIESELAGKTSDQQAKLLNSIWIFETSGRKFCLAKESKDRLLAEIRSSGLTDRGILWLDSALVLTAGRKKNRLEAPVLGTGGNVGNSDFSATFAQTLPHVICLNETDPIPDRSSVFLEAALFGSVANELPRTAVGQFDPGNAGGANSSQGMVGDPSLNPWDYILMCEGALLLAGSATRRLGASADRVSFPFTVDSSQAGFGSSGKDKTRGEIWLPIWNRAARLGEIQLLLSEGRAEVFGKPASSGVTFAQAVASLGVDRGISSFFRYQFQERLGQSYLAVPLTRFEVTSRQAVDLLRQMENKGWLDQFRRACAAKNPEPPLRFSSALKQLDDAVFDYCHHGGNGRFAKILIALGRIERELAISAGKVGKRKISPAPLLSPEWLDACNDGTVELRIAVALASITATRSRGASRVNSETSIGPMRRNLEAVKPRCWSYEWAEAEKSVAWSGGSLCRNLLAVIERRLIEADRCNLDELPLSSLACVDLDDIGRFLEGQTDDRRIEELLWGAILVRHDQNNQWMRLQHHSERELFLSRAYSVLKLVFLPSHLALKSESDGTEIRSEPRILTLLRSGQVASACEIAARRLRASGLIPMPGPLSGGGQRRIEVSVRVDALRLAASLLIPVRDVETLKSLVLRASAQPE